MLRWRHPKVVDLHQIPLLLYFFSGDSGKAIRRLQEAFVIGESEEESVKKQVVRSKCPRVGKTIATWFCVRTTKPLLNVVYTKLRGKALLRLPQIKGETWQEVENNLYSEFAEEKNIGTLIKEIETLSQKQNEGFNSYRLRAEKLHQWIRNLPGNQDESFAAAMLRKHFLGGLRSGALAQAGTSQRDKTFPELLDWLRRECEEGEEVREIHRRVQGLQDIQDSRNTRWQRQPTINNQFRGPVQNWQNNYSPNYGREDAPNRANFNNQSRQNNFGNSPRLNFQQNRDQGTRFRNNQGNQGRDDRQYQPKN